MNKDLISAVEALEIEAGISKETMFDTIEKALREEYKAQYGNSIYLLTEQLWMMPN